MLKLSRFYIHEESANRTKSSIENSWNYVFVIRKGIRKTPTLKNSTGKFPSRKFPPRLFAPMFINIFFFIIITVIINIAQETILYFYLLKMLKSDLSQCFEKNLQLAGQNDNKLDVLYVKYENQSLLESTCLS